MEQLTVKKVKNQYILSNGQTVAEYGIANGIKPDTIRSHLQKGRTFAEAVACIGKRDGYKRTLVEYNGKLWTMAELTASPLNIHKCSEHVLRQRILKCKWSVDRALSTPITRSIGKGNLYVYQGQAYTSKRHLCNTLGLNYIKFHNYLNMGFSLEEAVNLSFTKEVTLLKYKGKNYTIRQLVLHPDNIYKLSNRSISERVLEKGMTVEEAFAIPKRLRVRRRIEYKGVVYPSLFEFLCAMGVREHYSNLVAINDDEMLFGQVEKLLANK